MHKFTCTECHTQPFYTTFAPVFEEPAYCPNCGQQTTVSYVGEVNHNPRFNEVLVILSTLYDIKKGSMRYGLIHLNQWMEEDLDKVTALLDELRYDVENGVE